MITYVLGLPGSGKTYYAVDLIYNNFSSSPKAKKDIKKNYVNCYTNINEFKFDKIENVLRLDTDVLYKNLRVLHKLYKDKCTDDELIEKAKELNIYRSLFIVDEAHNFFDVNDTVKVWWLTYHRHLFHDIVLITQNIALVNTKYKPLAEAFYKAKSNSLTLDKRYFVYTYFTESRLTQASKAGVKKIKKNKEVFELYKSGDSVESKNIILKYLLISAAVFILLFALAYFFYYKQEQKINSTKADTSINEPVNTTTYNSTSSNYNYAPNQTDDDYSSKKFIVLNCSYSVCSDKDLTLPPLLLKKFIDMELLHKYYDEKISDYLTVVYLSSSLEFYNFIKNQNLGVTNESDSMDINFFNSSSSK